MMFDIIERKVLNDLVEFYRRAIINDKETIINLALAFDTHEGINQEFNIIIQKALGLISNFYNDAEEYPPLEQVYEIYKDLLKLRER
jgi:hypothetical protein